MSLMTSLIVALRSSRSRLEAALLSLSSFSRSRCATSTEYLMGKCQPVQSGWTFSLEATDPSLSFTVRLHSGLWHISWLRPQLPSMEQAVFSRKSGQKMSVTFGLGGRRGVADSSTLFTWPWLTLSGAPGSRDEEEAETEA